MPALLQRDKLDSWVPQIRRKYAKKQMSVPRIPNYQLHLSIFLASIRLLK